jgi:endoglycosylceramidase
MNRNILFALLLFFLFFSSSLNKSISVDPLTTYLTDESGRFLFYHGINAIYKEFPYYPKTSAFDSNSSLSKQDFLQLREWGFNSIRLNIAWEGFEPKQG